MSANEKEGQRHAGDLKDFVTFRVGGSPRTESQYKAGRHKTGSLLTPHKAGRRGGEGRQEAKCASCFGLPDGANSGSDCWALSNLFTYWTTGARNFVLSHSKLTDTVVSHSKLTDTVVSHSKLTDTVVSHSKLTDTVVSHSKLTDTVVRHSKLTDKRVSCDYCHLFLAYCDKCINNHPSRSPCSSGAGPHHTTGGYAGKSDLLVKILCCWLLSHALHSGSSPVLAQAAAVPSPPYLTPLSPASRYQLVPPSQYNDTIFIFFNPASILNLRVNTRQSVFFNFTLYTRRVPSINNGIKVTTTRAASTTNNDVKVPIARAANTTNNSDVTSEADTAAATTATSQPPTSSPTSLPTTWANITRNPNTSRTAPLAPTYWVIIYSDDDSIARPLPSGPAAPHADDKGSYILMAVVAGRQHNFSVEARHIGRVTMSVAVVGDKGIPQASYVQAVAASQYQVTTIRGERTADIVFNSAAAAIAIIISFGIGAITDTDSLKRQLKYPVALIIGFCSQFIIMPVLAFGMAMMLPLQKDISFGLLCVACVPGGGLSHVAVIIADGDTALSLTMNLISVVAMLGTAPLWIFVLGQYFQTNPDAVLNPRMLPIYNFEIWLAATFFAYAFGLVIKRLRPSIADAILMWLIKPFLLLASILYITLGVYINMYVFELVNTYALLGAMLLPLCGCVVGGAMAAVCRQSLATVKTIALETSSLNCLVVMVALRFSLKQPDADLAAMIPIWVMFTIPGLFVSLAICNKAKLVLVHYWQNRNNKDTDMHNSSKAYSVSSSVVSPPGTTTLSAPLVAADGLDDDTTISTMSNQKVTVL